MALDLRARSEAAMGADSRVGRRRRLALRRHFRDSRRLWWLVRLTVIIRGREDKMSSWVGYVGYEAIDELRTLLVLEE